MPLANVRSFCNASIAASTVTTRQNVFTLIAVVIKNASSNPLILSITTIAEPASTQAIAATVIAVDMKQDVKHAFSDEQIGELDSKEGVMSHWPLTRRESLQFFFLLDSSRDSI